MSQDRNEHVRIVLDRRAIAGYAREHRRIFVDFSDRQGLRCCATGFVSSLDARWLTLETAGRAYSVDVDRVHVLEVIGPARPTGDDVKAGVP